MLRAAVSSATPLDDLSGPAGGPSKAPHGAIVQVALLLALAAALWTNAVSFAAAAYAGWRLQDYLIVAGAWVLFGHDARIGTAIALLVALSIVKAALPILLGTGGKPCWGCVMFTVAICAMLCVGAVLTSGAAVWVALAPKQPPDSNVLICFLAVWGIIEGLATILPALVLNAGERVVSLHPLGKPADRVWPAAAAPAKLHPQAQRPTTAKQPKEATERLIDMLRGCCHADDYGRLPAGIRLSETGEFVTSQAALGESIGCGKGTINRALKTLAARGSISLTTLASETRIRVHIGHSTGPGSSEIH
jgi:hypothetical protein